MSEVNAHSPSKQSVRAKSARPTEDSVRTRMAEAGITPSDDGVAGVLSNLIVLQDHVATLRAFALDPRSASAMRFEA